MNPLQHAHSSESNEHYAPKWLADAARNVLGGIDWDPMSSRKANVLIEAKQYNALDRAPLAYRLTRWIEAISTFLTPPTVWLNPPGGKLDRTLLTPLPRNEEGKQGGTGVSATATAWAILSHLWSTDKIRSAMFLAFNMSVFRTGQDESLQVAFPRSLHPLDACSKICVFKERIAFDQMLDTFELTTGEPRTIRVSGDAPPQDSAIIFLPPKGDYVAMTEFSRIFSQFGTVRL